MNALSADILRPSQLTIMVIAGLMADSMSVPIALHIRSTPNSAVKPYGSVRRCRVSSMDPVDAMKAEQNDYIAGVPTVDRTSCDCSMCQAGCKAMPSYLVPSDLVNFDTEDLQASEGATVMKNGKLIKLPTLIPKQREDGSCIFFEDGKCNVHEHSPYGCRAFSICSTPNREEHRRMQIGMYSLYLEHQEQGEYHQLTQSLPQAKPLFERKAHLSSLLKEIKNANN